MLLKVTRPFGLFIRKIGVAVKGDAQHLVFRLDRYPEKIAPTRGVARAKKNPPFPMPTVTIPIRDSQYRREPAIFKELSVRGRVNPLEARLRCFEQFASSQYGDRSGHPSIQGQQIDREMTRTKEDR